MRRLRRFVPGVIGLSLAALILWRTSATIEREAEAQQRFAVIVDAPVEVVALSEQSGRSDQSDQDQGAPTWHARLRPLAELERVAISLDGHAVEAVRDGETGTIDLPLAETIGAPGWHFVELEISRRGGRRERVVEPVLVGRFAEARQTGTPRPCAASFVASPMLVRSVIVPMLEDRLLPPLRENQYMGPTTQLRDVSLQFGDNLVQFDIEIAGINTLFVSGRIGVELVGDRRMHAELLELGAVEFRGELREQARDIGAGAGALVGGVIAGPLAPVGAAAGWFIADRLVTKKAREVVHEQVDAGLEQLDGVDLLPDRIELIRGQPRSAVDIGFCVATGVRATGVQAGIWIEPVAADELAYPLAVPGPIFTDSTPTIDALRPHEELRVELSIDAVNQLLTRWTASALLSELIGQRRAIDHANEELEAWTPLRLRTLTPTHPPTLTPAGGPEAGWAYGIGGLTVEVEGVDDQPWGQIFVAAAGTVEPTWDPEAGSLSLIGSLDRLDVTCGVAEGDGQGDGQHIALAPCFGEVLEAADVRSRIDAHLRPGARGLPSLALRELLADSLDLQLEALTLSRPRPGLLRLSAALRPGTVR